MSINKDENILTVNEIFFSIQGESSWVGLPCVFVRLTYCDLRCIWCDTEYAFYEGTDMTIDKIIEKVKSYNCKLVEITGGEPLLQENSLKLMKRLCDENFTVLLETGGHRDISQVDPRVHIIMDIKCPGSKMSHKNRWENINYLSSKDEVKFVIKDRSDYEWAKEVINKFNLAERVGTILFSPVFGEIEPVEIVTWILEDKLPVRFQIQLHKYIWSPTARGV
ncbi:MAG: 7-carboxy-7-deazaguanine synthase QueE [Candidatus Kryptonium sp.]|nr:7-carboxy-7-deazaguanine synthase QueE [Candidatus Kryptonium sp.]MCX7762342.1 7-carboxy-7-deazaguanine synthase QueE [Candidatus Kryptonium sp.]MDW8109064.1 7-carboxy-7-deazaguanine synthase QueE [Candidatus Kryptonium sp.]